jgi:hypothetical protein
MCLFGGGRAVFPLSMSGISGQCKHIERPLGCTRNARDVAGLARTGSADGTQLQSLARALPVGRDSRLAGQPAGRQRAEQ